MPPYRDGTFATAAVGLLFSLLLFGSFPMVVAGIGFAQSPPQKDA